MRPGFVICFLAALLGVAPPPAVMVSHAQTGASLARGWERAAIGPPGAAAQVPLLVVPEGPGLMAFAPGAQFGGLLWISADGRGWTRAPTPAFKPDERAFHFFAIGGLLLMTGATDQNQPRIWASDDEGATWHESPAQLGITAAAAGGDGVIAFSSSDPVSPATAVWTSADGLAWRALPQTPGLFDSAMVTSVVQGAHGLIAVGTQGPPEARAGAWTSPDGRTWSEAPNTGEIFGNGSDGSSIVDVVAGPRGVLAIGERWVGEQGKQFPEQDLWATADGAHWQREPAPFNDPNGTFGHLVAWQGGFVQFSDEGDEAALWSSPDGLSWTREGSDELFGGTARVTSAAAFRDGVVAVGSFARHPSAACLRTQDAEYLDLRVFQPAALLWTPAAAASAPPPTVDPSDPRSLKLPLSDLISAVGTSLAPGGFPSGDYEGAYINLCAADPALGAHRAYRLMFAYSSRTGFGLEALSIATASASTASAAFRRVGRLLAYPGAIIKHKRVVQNDARIGEMTRVLQLRLQGSAENVTWVGTMFTVAWRAGRVIGAVVAEDRQEAVGLAQQQLALWQHGQVRHRLGIGSAHHWG